MKKLIAILASALILAGTLSSCASYDSMSHSKCQANKSNNHRASRN